MYLQKTQTYAAKKRTEYDVDSGTNAHIGLANHLHSLLLHLLHLAFNCSCCAALCLFAPLGLTFTNPTPQPIAQSPALLPGENPNTKEKTIDSFPCINRTPLLHGEKQHSHGTAARGAPRKTEGEKEISRFLQRPPPHNERSWQGQCVQTMAAKAKSSPPAPRRLSIKSFRHHVHAKIKRQRDRIVKLTLYACTLSKQGSGCTWSSSCGRCFSSQACFTECYHDSAVVTSTACVQCLRSLIFCLVPVSSHSLRTCPSVVMGHQWDYMAGRASIKRQSTT